MARLRGFPNPLLEAPRVTLPRDRLVKLEIGFGKGASLLAAAAAEPATHFLGIEAAWAYLELVRRRAHGAGLANVQLLHGDGLRLLAALPAGCLAKISVLFPDPWPKRRHVKRRIVSPAFARLAAERLGPRGSLVFKTDHETYFTWALPLLDAEPLLERAVVTASPRRAAFLAPATHFERKYRREGRVIHAACYVRADRPTGLLP